MLKLTAYLTCLLLFLALNHPHLCAQSESANPPASARPHKKGREKSKVVIFKDPSLVSRFQVNGERTAQALDRMLMTYTGASNSAQAWGKWIQPTDVVAIHITSPGNPVLAVPHALIARIVQDLRAAGVEEKNIIIWDKFAEQMIASGWVPSLSKSEWQVASVIPGEGFDPKYFYFNEVVGQLIWGDLEFVGTQEQFVRSLIDATKPEENEDAAEPVLKPPANQISNRSFFAKIITQRATKIINIAILTDHPDLGILGASASVALASVDNSRRFLSHGIQGDPAIGEILQHRALKDKVALHIMLGTIAQFAGGPQFNPYYTQSPGLIFLSEDPVAVDSIALQELEAWRAQRKITPIGDNAKHLKAAEALGVGHAKPEQIEKQILAR